MNRPIRDWRDKRVWVVGASTGIGRALAEALIARGARVAVTARSDDKLRTLAAPAGRLLPLAFDVTAAHAYAPALGAIVEAWGGLDVAVFAAGTYAPVRAWELDAEQARRTFDTNVLGVIRGVAEVVPLMLRQGSGAIAVLASVAGYRGLPKSILYGATKAALINFTETLYLDLRPKGISVFLVNPGFVATPLTAQNDFRMPALIGPDEAAREILEGLARDRFEIHFPRRFTRLMKLAAVLPYRLYLALARRLAAA
jgi:NAD(P)-dependent dehydrogenase (short-subunit alcohol dehydrogenase family)